MINLSRHRDLLKDRNLPVSGKLEGWCRGPRMSAFYSLGAVHWTRAILQDWKTWERKQLRTLLGLWKRRLGEGSKGHMVRTAAVTTDAWRQAAEDILRLSYDHPSFSVNVTYFNAVRSENRAHGVGVAKQRCGGQSRRRPRGPASSWVQT